MDVDAVVEATKPALTITMPQETPVWWEDYPLGRALTVMGVKVKLAKGNITVINAIGLPEISIQDDIHRNKCRYLLSDVCEFLKKPYDFHDMHVHTYDYVMYGNPRQTYEKFVQTLSGTPVEITYSAFGDLEEDDKGVYLVKDVKGKARKTLIDGGGILMGDSVLMGADPLAVWRESLRGYVVKNCKEAFDRYKTCKGETTKATNPAPEFETFEENQIVALYQAKTINTADEKGPYINSIADLTPENVEVSAFYEENALKAADVNKALSQGSVWRAVKELYYPTETEGKVAEAILKKEGEDIDKCLDEIGKAIPERAINELNNAASKHWQNAQRSRRTLAMNLINRQRGNFRILPDFKLQFVPNTT